MGTVSALGTPFLVLVSALRIWGAYAYALGEETGSPEKAGDSHKAVELAVVRAGVHWAAGTWGSQKKGVFFAL